MMKVRFITESSEYLGDVDNGLAGGGRPIRLLDALNFPRRLRPEVKLDSPVMSIAHGIRTDRVTGVEAAVPVNLWLALDRIIGAFEDPWIEWSNPVASYERQSISRVFRVQLYMLGDFLIEGNVHTKHVTAGFLRDSTKFRAFTDVIFQDLKTEAPYRRMPFMAINTELVESWTVSELATEAVVSQQVGRFDQPQVAVN